MKRQIINNITNWAFLLIGLVNLVVGTLAAVRGDVAVSTTSLTAGLILLFAATVDRFESLKGLGIEAKTRQLDKKISEADEALQRLRELTELTGKVLVDFNSKMGRIGAAPSTRESINLAAHVRQLMKGIGSTDEVINHAMRPWAKMLCFDMARAQTRELTSLLHEKSSEFQSELQKAKKSNADDSKIAILNGSALSVKEFLELRMRKFHLLDLEDYPDAFLKVIDEAPFIDEQTRLKIRSASEKFLPGMLELRTKQRLSDAEMWIKELDGDETD